MFSSDSVPLLNPYLFEFARLETAGFPTCLLPDVVAVPAEAGRLPREWRGIPEGTPVAVAMGDLQCSIFAAQPSPQDAGMLVATKERVCFVSCQFMV